MHFVVFSNIYVNNKILIFILSVYLLINIIVQTLYRFIILKARDFIVEKKIEHKLKAKFVEENKNLQKMI